MGGCANNSRYSTWHGHSVLHILLSFGMLLFWWFMFFFPYRVLFFQEASSAWPAAHGVCRIAWLWYF